MRFTGTVAVDLTLFFGVILLILGVYNLAQFAIEWGN